MPATGTRTSSSETCRLGGLAAAALPAAAPPVAVTGCAGPGGHHRRRRRPRYGRRRCAWPPHRAPRWCGLPRSGRCRYALRCSETPARPDHRRTRDSRRAESPLGWASASCCRGSGGPAGRDARREVRAGSVAEAAPSAASGAETGAATNACLGRALLRGPLRAHLRPHLLTRLLGGDRAALAHSGGRAGRRLMFLNRRDQVALAHPGDPGDAQRTGEALELREQHRGEADATPAAARWCLVCDVGGARRHVGGVAQWFPSSMAGLPGAVALPGRPRMHPRNAHGSVSATAALP